jgi:putative transposase
VQAARRAPFVGDRSGTSYDNTLRDSFFAILQCGLIGWHRIRTPQQARLAVIDIIETWHDPHRRHSALAHASRVSWEMAATYTT